MLSADRLKECERLANAATPGPWYQTGYQIGPDPANNEYTEIAEMNSANSADGPFIAAARSTVPELLAEVRRLSAELQTTARLFRQAGAVLIDENADLKSRLDEHLAICAQAQVALLTDTRFESRVERVVPAGP